MSSRPRDVPDVVVLLGPTASGKTSLLERLFDGSFEVIVADSMQAYRGMDIGTAKPDPATLRRIRHHLVDILDPDEQYTCGEFVRLADEAVSSIIRRGRVPVLSGGTAYYIRGFLFGLPDSPRGDPEVRARLEAEADRHGLEALYAELCRTDAPAATAIHRNDRYRILRALEIQAVTGRPRSASPVPVTVRTCWRFHVVGLKASREDLDQRIRERVGAMFDSGLVAEVRRLLERGYRSSDPGLRGIGYREILDVRPGCMTLREARDLIAANTLRFAKRQMTFFRSFPGVSWTAPEHVDSFADLAFRGA